jgi:hypothetical protein
VYESGSSTALGTANSPAVGDRNLRPELENVSRIRSRERRPRKRRNAKAPVAAPELALFAVGEKPASGLGVQEKRVSESIDPGPKSH